MELILLVAIALGFYLFLKKQKWSPRDQSIVNEYRDQVVDGIEPADAARMEEFLALEEATGELLRLLDPHLKTLALKKTQKTFLDDYGRTVDDAFRSEVAYFRSHVVPQKIVEKLGPATVDWAIEREVSGYERVGRGKADARKRVEAFCCENPDLLSLALGCVASGQNSKELQASDFSHVVGLVPYKARVGLSNDDVLQAILDVASPPEAPLSAEDVFQEWFTGEQYERFVQKLLEQQGLRTRTTPTSGDQGIDIIGSVRETEIGFQCKRSAVPVGNKAVQEVSAGKSFYHLDCAVVVSNNGFTRSARQLASSLQVELLHHENLPGWLDRLQA